MYFWKFVENVVLQHKTFQVMFLQAIEIIVVSLK